MSSNPSDPLTKKLKDFYSVEPKKRGTLKLSKKEIKLLQKKDKTLTPEFLQDPGESAYFAVRLLAATHTRAEAAIKYRFMLPVVADRANNGKPTNIFVKGGYEDAGVDPYVKIIQPVADLKLLGVFNIVFLIRHSKWGRHLSSIMTVP